MGGYGSGRRPTKQVGGYLRLTIGSILDGAGFQEGRSGRMGWRTSQGAILARLDFRLGYGRYTEGQEPQPVCDYTFWPQGGAGADGRLFLVIVPGRAILVRCPEPTCRRSVRILYAKRAEHDLRCGRCAGVRYPRRSQRSKEEQEREELFAEHIAWLTRLGLSAAERQVACGLPAPTPKDLAETLALVSPLDLCAYLRPQERRLAALSLQAQGHSLRQIAVKIGISKSSVWRIVAAGFAGLDVKALFAERSDVLHRDAHLQG
jgi:hypothetical protein